MISLENNHFDGVSSSLLQTCPHLAPTEDYLHLDVKKLFQNDVEPLFIVLHVEFSNITPLESHREWGVGHIFRGAISKPKISYL